METVQQLRLLLVAFGWTYEQLAVAFDVSRRTITRWMRSPPPREQRAKIDAVYRSARLLARTKTTVNDVF